MRNTPKNLKKYLRQLYLQKRKTLSSITVLRQSQVITKKVMNLREIKGKNNISCYLPINNEVETKLLIDKLCKQGKNIFVPCFFKKDQKYHFTEFINWQELDKGPFAILQPKNPKVIDSSKIEVAILPGLAFAKTGVRLGYGKGVFDKLLSKTNTLKIGLAYDFQIIDEIPQEKHDLLMDYLVTEKVVYKLN